MFNERMVPSADLARQPRRFRARFFILELIAFVDIHLFYTLKSPHEVKMPPGAAEFAIRNRLKSDFLLFTDQIFYRFVLHRLEIFREIVPAAKLFRASFNVSGRRKLPTLS